MTFSRTQEFLAPLRNITFAPKSILPEVSVIGYYPYDQIKLLNQEEVDAMADEATELYIATMSLLTQPGNEALLQSLGCITILNFSDMAHETQFTIKNRKDMTSLTMIHHKDVCELGQRSTGSNGFPTSYNNAFTITARRVIRTSVAHLPKQV